MTIATPEEVALLAILYTDHTTRRAVASRNTRMLSRLYRVCLYSYEDHLKEEYGVHLQNQPGRFEIVQNNKVVYAVEDDYLGSVGNAVSLMLGERDRTPLPVNYPTAVSGKYRASCHDVVARIDVEGLLRVSGQISNNWPLTAPAVGDFSKAAAALPNADDTQLCAIINHAAAVFTHLRSVAGDCVVEDASRTGNVMTVAQLLSSGSIAKGGWTVVPGPVSEDTGSDSDSAPEVGCFSKAERKLCRLVLKSQQYERKRDDDGEYYVAAKRSAFSYIDSAHVVLPPLPAWEVLAVQGTPQSGVSPVHTRSTAACAPSGSYPAAVQIVLDYRRVDMNRFADIRGDLLRGGLSQEAQAFFEGLSKAKQQALLRPLAGRMSFDAAVTKIAQHLGVEECDALAEAVASRLVLAKSAVRMEQVGGVLYIQK